MAVSASRGLIEGHVRARVTGLPQVDVHAGCDVVGLTTTPGGRAVTGVRLLRRADHGAEEVLEADTVIDTTGRTSRAPAWLRALGLEGPDEERLPIDVAYATRRYSVAPGELNVDLAVVHGLTPDHPRGGVLAVVREGVAMITLAGILGDRPPSDPDGFNRFAASLRFPDIHEVIRNAEPIDDPVPYRFPASIWRHYERLGQLPDGFAVMGDSMCSFNPIYGQGMAIAAVESVALQRHLRRHGGLRTRRFHRELSRLLRPPWQMAMGADLLFPGVDKRRTRAHRLLGAYIARLHATAARDSTVACSFVRVAGLIDRPHRLLRPPIVWRVLHDSARYAR